MPARLGAVRGRPAAGVRGRGRGGASDDADRVPARRSARCWRPRRVVVAGCAGGGPILANPTRRRDRPSRRRRPPPVAVADPLPVVLPRDDGPHDRLTEWWYYTGHLRADDGAPLRLRVRHLPRRARRASRRRGSRTSRSPTRPATGSCTASGSRSAPQVDRSPRGPDGEPTGFDLALTGVGPDRPGDRPGRRPGRWPAPTATDRLAAALAPDEAAAAGSPGGLGLDLDADGDASRRPSTTATAGSTSGRPAARTTTRGRR